jgi:hypothetical protein
MVRCDQFYTAMSKDSGFCEKSPETVSRILKHINMRNKLESKVTQSEVLKGSSCPIGQILSEGASRPLHALKGADLDRALDLIIKNAEAKEIDDKSIAVGCKEVQEIVNQIVPPKAKKTATKSTKDAFDEATGILQSAVNNGIPVEDIPATIGKIDKLIRTLETNKAALLDRQAAANTRGGGESTIMADQQPEEEVA